MADLSELIAKLEGATRGAKELDRLVSDAVFGAKLDAWAHTTSIDAALAVVPSDWFWWVGHLDQTDRRFVATTAKSAFPDAPCHRGFSPTAALAICIAGLKARAATTATPETPHAAD